MVFANAARISRAPFFFSLPSHTVETWSYDPVTLSTGYTVDPLSLYAQFRDHRAERVSMAAERLLD